MFFEALGLTYHSPITIESRIYACCPAFLSTRLDTCDSRRSPEFRICCHTIRGDTRVVTPIKIHQRHVQATISRNNDMRDVSP